MRLQLNVGRQAVSIGLLVVMLAWLALAVLAAILDRGKPPGWLVSFALAICVGWIASAIYREMEIRAIGELEGCEPDPCSPLISIVAGSVNYDSDADSISNREGPPYGWVPILAGLLLALGMLWPLKVPWPAGIVALFLYLFAAGVENPWLACRMKKWPSFKDNSSTELVVLAILAAWATIEFTIGTPLGIGTLLWSASGWLVALVFCVIHDDIAKDETMVNAVLLIGLVVCAVIFIAMLAAAGLGVLPWASVPGFVIGVALTWCVAKPFSVPVTPPRSRHMSGRLHSPHAPSVK